MTTIDRTHEECVDCFKLLLEPPMCNGHVASPTPCSQYEAMLGNEMYHKRCHDCGKFVKKREWVPKNHAWKKHALCRECFSNYLEIKKSGTADTRTCDFGKVTKEQLKVSSYQHIRDVEKGINFFIGMLIAAAKQHDFDKIGDIDGFHRDFLTGFKSTTWWDEHRKINRHHLLQEDGVPKDVTLIDVLEMIVDCVMAGMGRSGDVYPLNISEKVLMDAFNNTANLLKNKIVVEA